MSIHFHHCPHCYEAFECRMACTIEPDLEDRGRPFGSHAICHDVICHIDRAIKKHNERLDQRKREALRRLRPPTPTSDDATEAGRFALMAASSSASSQLAHPARRAQS